MMLNIPIPAINISDYDYKLPDERIARYPATKRDQSKLLLYQNREIRFSKFNDLPQLLPTPGLIVFNNTKVIQARLLFRKTTGALIEIFCLEPYKPADYQQAFEQKKQCEWLCLIGNAKKWKTGHLHADSEAMPTSKLTAERLQAKEQATIVRFSWESDCTFGELLESSGQTPLPPYLNRQAEPEDRARYQTQFARYDGSVAAPTAGLHFTENILKQLELKGIKKTEVTLHVGAGTFRPVKSSDARRHLMHNEHIVVQKETIKDLLNMNGSLTAVGTTSVRTLESLYWMGVKRMQQANCHELSQWEAYRLPQDISVQQALETLLNYLETSKIEEFHGQTQLMIVPTYRFRLIDQLITNSHQPRSTLLLLIAAFVGQSWQYIYEQALKNNFRFLSYGDSMLLIP